MDTVTLKATPRTTSGKGPARRLRAAGQLPAVAYGHGNSTLPIAVKRDDLRAILTSDRGRNTIIDLAIDGGESFQVMVKEFEVHPLTRQLLHADFQRIDASKPVVVEVPFHTVGKSKGEVAGGTLLATLRTIKLRCLPTNIPDDISYDVSELQINDVIKIKDLKLPEGVESLMPPERKVVSVAPPRVETEKAEGEAAEGEAPAEGETPAEAKPEGEGGS